MRINRSSSSKVLQAPFLALLFLCVLVLPAESQVATGIYSLGTFDKKGFDTINVGNLNVNFAIPIFSKPGRGTLNFQYGLVFDNSIWAPVTLAGTTTWQPASAWGWSASTSGVTGLLKLIPTTGTCSATGSPSTDDGSFIYIDLNGAPHGFAGSISDCSSDPDTASFTASANDGSGFTLTVNAVNSFILNDNRGNTITPTVSTGAGAASVTDLNGNQISISSSGTVTDTTGSTVLSQSGAGTSSSPRIYTYPVWLNPTSSTASANATVHYSSYNIATAFGCSGISEYSQTGVSLVDYVQLADGQTYSFAYEHTPGTSSTYTGRLASVTLPTLGVISYTYSGGNNGIICADGGTATLQRSVSVPVSSWTYTRTPGSTLNATHTDVVDGASTANHAAYDFIADTTDDPTHQYFPVQHTQYEGATGTPLLSAATCYKAYPVIHHITPCSTTSLPWPIFSITTTSTFDGSATMQNFEDITTWGFFGDVQVAGFGSSGLGYSTQITESSYRADIPVVYSVGTTSNISANSTDVFYAYDYLTTLVSTSGLPQHSGIPSGSYASAARGNLTGLWPSFDGSTLTYSYTYTNDDAGQRQTSTDIKGNITTYTYDSTDTFITQITEPSIGGSSQTLSYSYDIASGMLKSSTDQNGNTTSYTYDTMLRPLTVTYPDGGRKTFTYSLAGTSPNTTISVLHSIGSSILTTSYVDAYGRALTTTDPSGSVDSSYDGNGNLKTLSNPYTTSASLYTQYAYDALARQTLLTEADSSTVQHAYSGNTVLITDEVGHQRKLTYDALGNVSIVLEPDSSGALSIETDYTYYQNPTTSSPNTFQTIIQQKGGSSSSADWRTRTLIYGPNGRLLSENTPEAGTTTYSYLNESSACSGDPTLQCAKTDANGTVTSYAYDALNRLTGKTYSGSAIASATPAVSYFYDQASYNGLTIANGKGLRTGMSDGSGATAWSFDEVGRPTATSKTLSSNVKQANYLYNYDGTVNSLQDFSGATMIYSYDNDARQAGVSDGLGNSYASNATYSLASQLTGLTHQLTSTSASYTRSIGYNTRLQPSTIQAFQGSIPIQNLTYTYGITAHNNGNISTIANGMDSTHNRDQSYSYDNMNRVQQGNDGTHWGQTYTYDNWGNLIDASPMSGLGGYNWSVTADAGNHLSNLSYDLAGEVTLDQFGNSYAYDAEGRILSAGSGAYVYDGDGYRVAKTVGSATTLYWPTAVAGISDESNSTATSFGKQVYIAGLHVWSEDISGAGKFLFQDHLGSARITGDSAGNLKDDIDYLPFGSVFANYGTASDNHYQFTGYESDAGESSTDYATFRNLSYSMGRFQRPDPSDGSYDFTDPQSLNRYAYVNNRPMVYIDPIGLDHWEGNCFVTTGSYWDGQTIHLYAIAQCPDPGPGVGKQGTPVPTGNSLPSGAPNSDPCSNPHLTTVGVGPAQLRQRIATANSHTLIGALFGPVGALLAYAQLVHTGGPQDDKNLSQNESVLNGPYSNAVQAGNISFGVTCPFGAAACQFAAGFAQTLGGNPNFSGTLKTGYDTPSDNAQIQQGQAMRTAGCHS